MATTSSHVCMEAERSNCDKFSPKHSVRESWFDLTNDQFRVLVLSRFHSFGLTEITIVFSFSSNLSIRKKMEKIDSYLLFVTANEK